MAGNFSGIGQAGPIATGRHLQVQRFVGPLGVVTIPELAKALLTMRSVTPGRALIEDLHLQAAMETLFLALILRMIRSPMKDFDSQAQ